MGLTVIIGARLSGKRNLCSQRRCLDRHSLAVGDRRLGCRGLQLGSARLGDDGSGGEDIRLARR